MDGRHSAPAAAVVGRQQRTHERALARLKASLGNRTLAILDSVAQLHYVTTTHLRRMHIDGGASSQRAAARTVQRTVRHLHGLGLIKVAATGAIGGPHGGSASPVWRLTPRGAAVLGRTLAGSTEPSLSHLAHVLAVAELVVRLHEAARGGPLDHLAVEPEPACWRSYVGPDCRSEILKPDLRVTLGVGEHELHWFVEIDRATESPKRLVNKMHRYLDAWREGGETQRAGVFPGVLWSVPDEKRAVVVREICRTMPGAPSGMFAVATHDVATDVLQRSPDIGVVGDS